MFNEYGSLPSNLCDNEAFHFPVQCNTCSEDIMQQVTKDSVSLMLFMGYGDVQGQQRELGPAKEFTV
jgi:hypothetical protein